ncbi:MAG: hypothetical protein CMC13_13350 [Flavobacteriaceae bacterium]|nr:hypothetical protein [Flavobacteriaceae bacterium]|tara:strand:+ start:4334 stop:5587 length:1254 start_codon:yes stop_codon:yes gene_type:complete
MKFLKSEFDKNVVKVFSGTLLAQLIGICIYPILTRLYTPEDFSNLALYLSTVTVVSSISSLKYEKAILIPENDNDALGIVKLSILINLFFSLLSFLLYFSFGKNISNYFNLSKIDSWLIFVPVTITFRGFYNIINIWFNRKSEYAILSKNRIFTSGSNGGLKVILQWLFKLKAFGLILSEALSQFLALIFFGKKIFLTLKKSLNEKNKYTIKQYAYKYKDYPLFSMPADFLNVFARELPVFMLTTYFGAGIVGFYMLTKKMLDVPFTLLSTSILEVFRREAITQYYEKGNCREVFVTTLKKLLLISIVPFLILYFIAPWTFRIVFGEEWIKAGYFAQILVVLYFFKFISSPLTYVFFVVNKLRLNTLLQVLFFIITFCSFYFGNYLFGEIEQVLLFYAISMSFIYLLYLGIAYKLSC